MSTEESNCHLHKYMNYSCHRSALGGAQSSDTMCLGFSEKRWAGLASFPYETQRGKDGGAKKHQADTPHCENLKAVKEAVS